jgi:long-chain acyl-CoA synthetase
MFTSGSTGASKGVCLSQRNLIVSAISSVEHALVDADSFKNIICLPMYHIFCFAVDFLWLIIKGCPIAINSSVIALKDEIKEFEASRVCMVPMMAETILTGLHMTKNQNRDLNADEVRELTLGKKFKRIILGGAFIEPALRKGLVSYGIEVICGYGMTEVTGPVSSE